jgi:hypothetical protein
MADSTLAQAQRLGSIIVVRTPTAVLADLVPPTSPSSAV